jgi:hypothetical protein
VNGCGFTASGAKYHKTNPEHKTDLSSYFKLNSQGGRRGLKHFDNLKDESYGI